jgi:hypothetical protein
MATELKALNKRTTVTRFWGGEARGVCLQLTQSGQERGSVNPQGFGFVQLTREDAAKLAVRLMEFAVSPMDME